MQSAHGHRHGPEPAFSLFLAPAAQRLAGVALVLGLLWAGVWWAMS